MTTFTVEEFERSHFLVARANILGVGICVMTRKDAVDQIEALVRTNGHHYVCVSNVHTVMMSQDDEAFRDINNQAALAVPDGMPLVWAERLQGFHQEERIYGPDLLLAACENSLKTGSSHYFYGGEEGVPEALAKNLKARFPGLRVAGCYSPPFRKLTQEEEEEDAKRISDSGADILWVGLGAPKQERWMAEHVGRIDVPVMVGVGAAFAFHTGQVKQAPAWMQRHGLEWVFRLLAEPKRLWRRYLYYNPRFLWLTLCQLTGLRKYELPRGKES